jgi:hypothetical protein
LFAFAPGLAAQPARASTERWLNRWSNDPEFRPREPILVGSLAVLAGAAAVAQSPADQLQKGIYAEETAGDIDGAIQLFWQVANSPNKTIVAQVQYQLVLCMLQRGDRLGGADAEAQSAGIVITVLKHRESHRDYSGRRQPYPYLLLSGKDPYALRNSSVDVLRAGKKYTANPVSLAGSIPNIRRSQYGRRFPDRYSPSISSRNSSRTLPLAAISAFRPSAVARYTLRSDLPLRWFLDRR